VTIQGRVLKHVTGHAGNGNMKINEFNNDSIDEFQPNFDIVDDVCVYMRNDPIFYRKHFFPMIDKMSNDFANKKKINPKTTLFPVVEKAIKRYVEVYELARTDADVFTEKDRMAIAKKIYAEEMHEIKKGTYNS
jgi:hypothetical protein|tara:strand:- start:1003 stop:1404 length:402 start_codon:yes stop_codon:yes gene_type:complete